MSDLGPEITIEDQIEEARREHKFRQWVYSRAVAEKRMNSRLADRRIAVMARIIKTLEEVRQEEISGRFFP